MFSQVIRLQVLQRVEVSLAEVYGKGWEMRHLVCSKAQKDWVHDYTLFVFPCKKTYFA